MISPPGAPEFVSGIVSFAGTPVAAIRPDVLLGLVSRAPGFYAPLIVLKTEPVTALHVDAIERLVPLNTRQLAPWPEGTSFNACAEAQFEWDGAAVTVLCVDRLLLKQESAAIAGFLAIESTRLEALEGGHAHDN
jgi:chemotaxis signal transduction protein